jgi:hypothetical protein
MTVTYTITIRKADTKCTPANMLLTTPDMPPDMSTKDIQVYYNNIFNLVLNNNDYNLDDVSNTINKIYDYINTDTQYTVNYGDIIELPNKVFYFFYLDPILIN